MLQDLERSFRRSLDDVFDVEKREVSLSLMSDPDIYDLEMEKIFSKTWLFLGHDSEIPRPGDYVVRDMGEDQVIVTRDRSDKINVLLNVCTHRAMRVCMAEQGHSPILKCIYHGWAFRSDGSFLSAPVEREQMHGDIHPKEELGLTRARVHVYAGLIFATWNHDGPSFDEYLGDHKYYLDMIFARTDDGMECLGPPQRAIMDANWKCAGEQWGGDGFHTISLHRSLLEMGSLGRKDGKTADDYAPAMYGINIGGRQGHHFRMLNPYKMYSSLMDQEPHPDPMTQLRRLPPAGMTKDMVEQLPRHLSPGQLRVLATTPPGPGGLFPNINLTGAYYQRPDGTLFGRAALHVAVPRGPNKLEFMNWVFAEKSASPELKDEILYVATQTLGTTGMIEQDDAETWGHMQRNARGRMGRKQTLKYQALLGENRPADWEGGGMVFDGFAKDDTQWLWWMRWHELMSA